MNDYKKRIRKEVLASFNGGIQGNVGQHYWEQNPSSKAAIERVKERHVLNAIDDYERKHKLGDYKPQRRRR